MKVVVALKSYAVYSRFRQPILHRSFRGHLNAGRDPALIIETGNETSTEQAHGKQWKMHEKALNFIFDIPELLIWRYLLAGSASSIPITRDFPKGGAFGSLLISALWCCHLQREEVLWKLLKDDLAFRDTQAKLKIRHCTWTPWSGRAQVKTGTTLVATWAIITVSSKIIWLLPGMAEHYSLACPWHLQPEC